MAGAGTGYSSAILGHIGLDVVALESSAALAAQARDLGVETVEGPLEAGVVAGEALHFLFQGVVEEGVGGAVEELGFEAADTAEVPGGVEELLVTEPATLTRPASDQHGQQAAAPSPGGPPATTRRRGARSPPPA